MNIIGRKPAAIVVLFGRRLMVTQKALQKSLARVVVFIQENKTTDFYFPTLAARGADVRVGSNLLSALKRLK